MRAFVIRGWFCLGLMLSTGCVHPSMVYVAPEAVGSLTIRDLNENSAVVDIELIIRSHSDDDFELRDVNASVAMAGMELGDVSVGDFSLPARQRTSVPLTLEVPYANFNQEFVNTIADGRVPYSATFVGTVASSGGIHVRTRLRGTMVIAEDAPVRLASRVGHNHFHLKGLQLRGVTLTGVRFAIIGSVHNPLPIPITVRSIHYDAEVEGTDVGGGVMDERSVVLSPQSETSITLEHSFFPTDPVGLLRVIGELGPDTRAQIKGRLEIDPLGGISSIPFEVDMPFLPQSR